MVLGENIQMKIKPVDLRNIKVQPVSMKYVKNNAVEQIKVPNSKTEKTFFEAIEGHGIYFFWKYTDDLLEKAATAVPSPIVGMALKGMRTLFLKIRKKHVTIKD